MSSKNKPSQQAFNTESSPLSDEELLRYSRQLLLEPFGFEAQTRFKQAHVLIIGVGGLGCPAALYLAAAGIGQLTLADHDQLDLTNLQRQILYRDRQIGANKSQAAAANLNALNPHVKITPLSKQCEAHNLSPLVEKADVVVDCTDNLSTRYAINAACVKYKKPLASAAAIGMEGHFTFFDAAAEDAPCYQCMVPDTGQRAAENCATSGVLGPVLGTMGSLQALTVLKYLAGLDTQKHQLMRFDALSLNWQKFKLVRDPKCPVCSHSNSAF